VRVGEVRGAGRPDESVRTVVLDTVVAHGGRVIKNLGDEVLFVADDSNRSSTPANSVRSTLRDSRVNPEMSTNPTAAGRVST